jgi:hypothetical protein
MIVSGGTRVWNYGTTNEAPTKKANSSSHRKGDRVFKRINGPGIEIKNDPADEGQQKFTGLN